MAVLTLHRPGATTRPDSDAPLLGNYLDLSSDQVRLFQSDDPTTAAEELKQVISAAPKYAIIASVDKLDVLVDVAFVGSKPPAEDVPPGDYSRERLAFDLMTREDAGDGHSAGKREFNEVNLSKEGFSLGLGTRAILRFDDPRYGRRYFKMLVMQALDTDSAAPEPAFAAARTAIQFEELVANRVLVPLGIASAGCGFAIATSERIKAHFISAKTSELAWSIRPAERSYVGAEIYQRPFPIASVVWKQNVVRKDDGTTQTRTFLPFPPAWVGAVTQHHLSGPSYLNSTYSIAINHAGRVWSDDDEFILPRGAHETVSSGVINTVRYKYDLYMVDGSKMEFRDYDPPVDVEDED